MRLVGFAFILMGFLPSPARAQSDFGVGSYRWVSDGPCLTDIQRRDIRTNIARNQELLRSQGLLAASYPSMVFFTWPLQAAAPLTDYGYHGISNFVDHDGSYPNRLLDYHCGARTYDLSSGYNHAGTDIFTWPFAWNKMDSDAVEVVAAAAGTIVHKADGHFDRSCGFGGGNWNAVYVTHADGSTAWYGHLKNGSVTAKGVGQSVSTGEYLGVVGSSGNSTGPHLHFEVYDGANDLIDPFAGSCNGLNASSWWASQPPYDDSALNKLSTHWAPVEWGTCPNPDIANEADTLEAGSTIYFYAFGRDGRIGQPFDFWIYRSDSTLAQSWQYTLSGSYSAFYLYWSWFFPLNEVGDFVFRVQYEGQVYEHDFHVSPPVPVLFTSVSATPLPAGVRLDWDVIRDESLVGFDVYRQDGGSAGFTLVTNNMLDASVRRHIDDAVSGGVTYHYQVRAVTNAGANVVSSTAAVTALLPQMLLQQNYPNPFNPSTVIEYTLAQSEHVDLGVFDTAGRRVATLDRAIRTAGRHTVVWDGRSATGAPVATGVYFYRLHTRSGLQTRKMVLLK